MVFWILDFGTFDFWCCVLYFVFLDLLVFVFSILYFWILAFWNLYFWLLDQWNFGIWISYLVFCIFDFVFLDVGFSILNCLILDILDFWIWILDVGFCFFWCLHVRLFGFLNFWDFAFCDLDSGCWIVVVGTCILYLLILGFGLAFEIFWNLYFGIRVLGFLVFGLWIPEFVTFLWIMHFACFVVCNLDFVFLAFGFWIVGVLVFCIFGVLSL